MLTAAPRFNFATGLLLHSPELNAGEGAALERMRQLNQQYHGQALPRSALINYSDASRSTNQSPLNSPELQKSAEQIQQSSQTYQQSSEQYTQAVNHNQQAAAQFLEASRLMGTAAGQLAAAARQPVPVTVSVSGGNITAAVSQAAERDNRRN